jgi:TRAP transporter TAXI family solute receptor
VTGLLGAGVLTLGLAGPVGAAESEVDLPNTMAWTAYGVGSSGYSQAVAIGKAFKDAYGVNLRVLPGKNDISRTVPLREGKVHASATGLASYFSQEGVFAFADPDWGPQPVRILLTSIGNTNLAIGAAADSGIDSIADLEGKRVVWVRGAPALNYNVEAVLWFAGLTWDDVERVEFSGYGASWDGIINDQADAAWAITTSGKAVQLDSAPRGLTWPPMPHDDEKAWDRLATKAPYMTKHTATEGAGISEENPHEGGTYPYPILTVYADQKDEVTYNLTKAMVEQFDNYKDGAPGASGWSIENQDFTWAVPYHEGAVRYLKEIGAWSEEAQAHNDRLIERQEVLAQAWDDYTADAPSDEEAFQEGWMEARAAALEEAGFDPVFE